MKRLHGVLLSGVLLLGAVLVGGGISLWLRADHGPVYRFYSGRLPQIPAGAYLSTWGFRGSPTAEPDEWNFNVIFAANNTADVVLAWNRNQTVLYQKTSANLNETFVVALPRTTSPWSWDWFVRNPHDSTLEIKNFTVIHYSLTYPERKQSVIALGAGTAAVVLAGGALAYFTRRDSRLKSPNLSQQVER